MAKFKKYDKVIHAGYEFTVQGYYDEGMVNIRGKSGDTCVSESELTHKHTPEPEHLTEADYQTWIKL